MKKLLYFGLCICAVFAMCFCAPLFSNVKAEETTDTTIAVKSSNEFFSIFNKNVTAGQKFVLTTDIVLDDTNKLVDLVDRNINDIEFDGNGHTIVTSYPLFNVIGEKAVVRNLTVIATKIAINDFTYQVTKSTVNSFGLVACDLKGGKIFNVCATCESISKLAPAEEKLSYTYGVLKLGFNGYAQIGGMFGTITNGSFVQNCFVQTKLDVTQKVASNTATVIGGFVGYVENSTIINCYAVPVYKELIAISYVNNVTPSYIVGGFAGNLYGDVCCKNVFVGGYLPNNDEQNNRVVGKIFGNVSEGVTNATNSTKISRCYSYNTSDKIGFCGIISKSSKIDVLSISENNLNSILTFGNGVKDGEDYVWDLSNEWDTAAVWCAKSVVSAEEENFGDWSVVEKWNNMEFAFPVLQIFQTFSIVISEISEEEGVTATLVDENEQPLLQENFAYGTTVYIKIEITQDYLPYKVIDALKFKNETCKLDDPISDKQEAIVPIVVSEGTSGSYYVKSKNIPYYVKVKSQYASMGTVKITKSTSNLSENDQTPIELNSLLSITANSTSQSYAFEKWVWLDEDGNEVGDVYTGMVSENEADNHLAQQTMNLFFGDSEYTESDYVHLFLKMEDDDIIANNSIPYVIEDNKKIFMIQANFSQNIQKLKVYVKVPSDACQVYISENECEGVVDEGMLFTQNVTAGTYVKVKIVVSDEYKFVGWTSLTDKYNITNLIDTKTSNVNSPEIYVKITEPVMLEAKVALIEESKTDLTWLWWALGGVGAAGVITIIVCLIVVKRKNESFIRYY